MDDVIRVAKLLILNPKAFVLISFIWHRLEVVNDTFDGGIFSSLVCASPVGPHGTLTVVDDDCENRAKHHHDPANYFRVFLTGPSRNEFDADDADGKN